MSEWKAAEIADALRIADEMGFGRLVSSQPQYNMLWRVIESEVMPPCEREGVGQIVWSPIAQGVLTGKYRPLASDAGLSLAQLAIAWVLRHANVSATTCSRRSTRHSATSSSATRP